MMLFALSVLDHSDQYCLHHLCRVLAPGIVMFLFHTVDCRSCQKYCSAYVYFTVSKYGCEKRNKNCTCNFAFQDKNSCVSWIYTNISLVINTPADFTVVLCNSSSVFE